jgi:uncharacterized protein
MKSNLKFSILLTLVLTFGLVNISIGQVNQKIAGIWLGKLIINPKMELNVAFEIYCDETDSLSAVMHSIDQKQYDIAVNKIKVTDDTLKFKIGSLKASFKGKIKGSDSLIGSLSQGKRPWILNLAKVDKLPFSKPNRPQEPKRPFSYFVENVEFRNPEANISIAGTYTRPKMMGKYPTVLLISGSGPNDRDESIFGHKVFLVLADYLTRSGIAVLRVDDRGTGETTGKFLTATILDLASDAKAAIDYLKTRTDVNRIGVIGHSFGGDIAPIVAARSEDVSFVVLMAGSGVTLSESIYAQCEAIYKSMNVSDKGIKLNYDILEAAFETLRSEKNDSIARTIIDGKFKIIEPRIDEFSAEELKKLEIAKPLKADDMKKFFNPALRFDLFYKPIDHLIKVKCPLLAINGDKDIQVLSYNLDLIEKAIKSNGNRNVKTKLFEGKNHLLQTCKTCTLDEYGDIEETIAPDVLKYISEWIINNSK